MKTTKQILGFDDTRVVIIGIPLVALFVSAMMFPEILLASLPKFLYTCFLVSLGYTTVYWLVFRQGCIFWRRKFPRQEDTGRRIAWLSGSVVVGYFALKVLLDPLLHPLVSDVMGDHAAHEIGMSIASMLVSFMVLGIYETLGLLHQLKTAQLEKERLLKENIQSQLESLRNQVNPHFFFNSLNTLAYLIPEDPEKAVNFVRKLSQTYRYILDVRERELVLLSEELDFLNAFVSLLKERFGENLHVEVAVGQAFLSYKIIPLALQMLFENAIKHNVVSAQHPLRIEVRTEGSDRLLVCNNLQRKNKPEPGVGMGLENIKSRCRLLCDREVEVKETATEFCVILPLLPHHSAAITHLR